MQAPTPQKCKGGGKAQAKSGKQVGRPRAVAADAPPGSGAPVFESPRAFEREGGFAARRELQEGGVQAGLEQSGPRAFEEQSGPPALEAPQPSGLAEQLARAEAECRMESYNDSFMASGGGGALNLATGVADDDLTIGVADDEVMEEPETRNPQM